MKNLGEIESIVFQNKILLMLDARWHQFSEQNNLKFEAKLDKNGRLILCGPRVKGLPQKSVMMDVDSDNG